MTENESPVEVFKRATAATLRAMAEQDELEVSFSNDAPSVSGKRVRIRSRFHACATVDDVVLSSEPSVALRASVRRP